MHATIIRHIDNEGPGLWADVLAQHNIEWTPCDLHQGDQLPNPNDTDLLLVMGAAIQVWEEDLHDFLILEKEFIKNWVVTLKKPYFGSCFGHQLLGDVIGGNIAYGKTVEIGMCTVEANQNCDDDPVFKTMPRSAHWVQWHKAEVATLPAGARCFAGSNKCAIQAMGYGNHAYSTQFHPETDGPTFENWLTNEEANQAMRETAGDDFPAIFAQQAKTYLTIANENAKTLFNAWLRHVMTKQAAQLN